MTSGPEIHEGGVVVIGRNEGDRLVRCLTSLGPVGWPVVYVDSGSSDGSVDAAQQAGAHVVHLDMTRPFTAGRARQEGWHALSQLLPGLQFVQFIDGDCEVFPGWVASALQALNDHPQVAAVCGRRVERFPDSSVYNRLCDAEWNTPVGLADACGGDALMRHTALQQVGGFDAVIMAGEEPELCLRLRQAGWQILRIDAEMTWHDAAMVRFRQFWRRAERSGFGYAQVWDKSRKMGEPLYARMLAKAMVWGGALPLAAMLAAIVVHPALFVVWPIAIAAQALRLAVRFRSVPMWLTALVKPAEFLGVLRYGWRCVTGRASRTISYK